MNTAQDISALAPDAKAELQETCDRVAQGIRDPEAAMAAIQRMNRMREQLRQRIGVQEIAVDLVRQSREGQ